MASRQADREAVVRRLEGLKGKFGKYAESNSASLSSIARNLNERVDALIDRLQNAPDLPDEMEHLYMEAWSLGMTCGEMLPMAQNVRRGRSKKVFRTQEDIDLLIELFNQFHDPKRKLVTYKRIADEWNSRAAAAKRSGGRNLCSVGDRVVADQVRKLNLWSGIC